MIDPSTMDETLSILAIMAGLCILPLLMVAGLALLQRWERAPQKRNADTMRDLNSLTARIAALEAGQSEVSAMAERLDFLEAVLARPPAQPGLPASDTPRAPGGVTPT
jgi:Tfp pilus assembly protein PilN